jgi:hypothetical protein
MYGRSMKDNPEEDATAELTASGRSKRRAAAKVTKYTDPDTDNSEDEGGAAASARRRKASTRPVRSAGRRAAKDSDDEEFKPDAAGTSGAGAEDNEEEEADLMDQSAGIAAASVGTPSAGGETLDLGLHHL